MEILQNKTFTGERAMFKSNNKSFENCIFEDGESPLKESNNIVLNNCFFKWKYPLWYCKNIKVANCVWDDTGRSGIWYTNDISITDCTINAPKQFRRCKNINIDNVKFTNAIETMWMCDNVTIKNCHITGDYFLMNSSNIYLENVIIDGNYCFDGCKNVYAINCVFNSKDAFWNSINVKIINSKIIGEYLSWNTYNIEFENCEIQSNQGLCYIDYLTLKNCYLYNTFLSFEFCSNVDALILSVVDSIKNPISGIIKCTGVKELIMDPTIIDPTKTKIEVINE